MVEIVAEIGASHNGELENALNLIKAAKDAGADHVKLQTFEPEEMAIPGYIIQEGPWAGRELVDLYKQAHTPKEWHEPLFNYARDIGIGIFSTPFSKADVDFLETLDCPRYKIASAEIGDASLIGAAASTGKPIILSTGMAITEDVRDAISLIDAVSRVRREAESGLILKDYNITVLSCVSEYPATSEKYQYLVYQKWGISDHTLSAEVARKAVDLGACMIEKHIRLEGDTTGLDSGFALPPSEFTKFVQAIRKPKYPLKRSLYYAQDLEAGTLLEQGHFKTARPNLGISPAEAWKLYGKTLPYSVKKNEPVRLLP